MFLFLTKKKFLKFAKNNNHMHFYLVFRYYAFIEQCKNPKACTIILRGASKDVLNEVDRNFQDAMNVARNVLIEPFLVPGGGAGEMEIAK